MLSHLLEVVTRRKSQESNTGISAAIPNSFRGGITCTVVRPTLLILDSTLSDADALDCSTMATYPSSFLTSHLHSGDGVDLAHIKTMGPLLAALHTHFRAITTPLTYEQLQKNENVCSIYPKTRCAYMQVALKVLKPVTSQLQQNEYLRSSTTRLIV